MNRALDVTVACILILFTSPLMVIVVLAIKLDGPGPVFSRTSRFGHDRPNRADILKFRTTVYEPANSWAPRAGRASGSFCMSPESTICRGFSTFSAAI